MQQHKLIQEQHIAGQHEASLVDSLCAPNTQALLFEPQGWSKQDKAGAGRGSAWFVSEGEQRFVLRQFRRGGALAQVISDTYFFWGEDNTRSFAEFRLLAKMWQDGLPVPKPYAAHYRRSGLGYRAALLTWQIPNSQSWSQWLQNAKAADHLWAEVGQTIALFHSSGVDHADLNAHNILVDTEHKVWLIDFDKGRIRERKVSGWREKNMQRLLRSLKKIFTDQRGDEFINQGWLRLQQAYTNRLAQLQRQS